MPAGVTCGDAAISDNPHGIISEASDFRKEKFFEFTDKYDPEIEHTIRLVVVGMYDSPEACRADWEHRRLGLPVDMLMKLSVIPNLVLEVTQEDWNSKTGTVDILTIDCRADPIFPSPEEWEATRVRKARAKPGGKKVRRW